MNFDRHIAKSERTDQNKAICNVNDLQRAAIFDPVTRRLSPVVECRCTGGSSAWIDCNGIAYFVRFIRYGCDHARPVTTGSVKSMHGTAPAHKEGLYRGHAWLERIMVREFEHAVEVGLVHTQPAGDFLVT